jgi:hypothetical protein
VCYLKEKPELKEGPFLKEVKNLIFAIAESIAQIIELDWAEIEIRKYRDHVENLIKNSIRDIREKE